MGISSILVPYSQQLWHLYSLIFIFGICSGAWVTVSSVWLIELWQQNSAPVLQLSGVTYSVGIIFGPLLDEPYLTGELENDYNETYNSNSAQFNIFVNIERRSKLKTPFLISGIIQMIGIYCVISKILQKLLIYSK